MVVWKILTESGHGLVRATAGQSDAEETVHADLHSDADGTIVRNVSE
jgi:hypothetical protein